MAWLPSVVATRPVLGRFAKELLQKAVKAGYKDTAHMAKDSDLDSLRGREDPGAPGLMAEVGKQEKK